MNPQMLVIFNHSLTESQRTDARHSLGVATFVAPPPELLALWSQLPPDAPSLVPVLAPVFDWLAQTGRKGDFVLVQGEFGATFLVAQKAQALGLIPVYATTRREAVEQVCGDKVQLTHQFCHVRFRRYEIVPE